MTRKEMSEIFAVMLLAYPNAEVFKGGIAKLEPTINLWTACLPEVDFWTGQQAVVKLIRECKFPPTIAEFKEKAEEVQSDVKGQIQQAWNEIKFEMLASEDAECLLCNLPQESAIRRAVEAIGGLSRIVLSEECIYPNGHKEIIERYNYNEFAKAYEKALRQSSPPINSRYKMTRLNGKQMGEKI